jgi:hypothetical protein
MELDMKTLREIELEYKVRDLELKLYAMAGKSSILGREDDIQDVASYNTDYKELPMVCRVAVKDEFSKTQVILKSFGENAIGMAYYVDKLTTPSEHHLQQALVSMHEKLMYDIVRMRMDNNK